ncbi:hypothetical protein [Streptomyces sp. NPDC058255]|uniref:hypothetical protein n=1 Tax=Streptomyces sp. NPDC058255 TaxID=3346407 RepID=UPI0036F1882C
MRRALVSGASDRLTHLYLRQGELTALLHMLEYAESGNPSVLNRLLAADLGARAGRPPEAAQTHKGALQEANHRRQEP